MAPTVYIAHSRDDRSRFVDPFSLALGRAGITAEADPWQLGSRDSLIDRIFSEGLKGSLAFIVILSRFNSSHEWTQFELEESVVDRIEAVSRFVVILLDSTPAPGELPARVRVFDVKQPGDLMEISTILQELAPILTIGRKTSAAAPARGEPDKPELFIPGLEATETTLLALACRSAIENNSLLVKAEDISRLATPMELEPGAFRLALEALDSASYIKAKRANGGQISVVEVERRSFGSYMNHILEDFDEVVGDLADEIIGGVRDNETLVERSQLPPLVVTYILDELDATGQITVIRQMKGNRRIKRISPEFRKRYAHGR